jgi:hypothetical protein
MVGAFTLRRKPGGSGFQARAAASAQGSSVSHADVIQPKKPRNGQSKNGSAARASKPKIIRQPMTALVPAGGPKDDSFEEF